jgi:hypothetical protein
VAEALKAEDICRGSEKSFQRTEGEVERGKAQPQCMGTKSEKKRGNPEEERSEGHVVGGRRSKDDREGLLKRGWSQLKSCEVTIHDNKLGILPSA